jgi:hypothetical protein
MSLYYNVHVTLHQFLVSTRSHILDSDSSPLRRNKPNRRKLGLSPFQQIHITQYLLYELFKVEQKATDLIKCKKKKKTN